MRIHYLPWSPEIEAQALHAMHVGLMPLPDDDWTRGKCSFKMLQYMSCGKPVVVSPVGMNAEILALGRVGLAAEKETDWYEALEYLYTHRADAQDCGKSGRSVVEAFFSRQVVSEKLSQVFQALC
jgi:glycosyltransferase involved in cell wall biosynthesis